MSQLRRIIATVAAALMTLSLIPTVAAVQVFNDVADGSEFAMYINGLSADGIVTGVGGNFFPQLNTRRAEMTKFMNGAAGLEQTIAAGAPHFDDVPQTHTLYGHVETAYANGVVQGRAPRKFVPDDPVLRQETAKIVMETMRAVDTKGYFVEQLIGGPHFTDVPTGSEFYGYIETLYNLGCVRGYGNSMFGPRNPTLRQEMAKIVYCAREVLRNGPPAVPVGAPARLRLEASESQIYPDAFSNSTITATVVDGNGSIVGGYNGPVSCETNLGTLVKSKGSDGSDSLTIGADSGRAQFTLVSAKTEGTATVTCETGTLPEAVVQVVFSKAAPRVRSGFGSSSISGVGTIEVILTDDKVTNFLYDDDFTSVFNHVRGGISLVEVYVFDDEGDPNSGDETQCTIVSGQGHLQTGFPTSQPTTGTRSVRDTTNDNGRVVFYWVALEDQQEGTVEIECTDLDTSPTLRTDAELETFNIELAAEIFPFSGSLTTRNAVQIAADEATLLNEGLIWVLLKDENGDPIEDSEAHEITARFTGGETSGARFVGCATVGCATPTDVDTQTFLWPVVDSLGNTIPGLYTVKVLAGDAEGSLEIEIRDQTAIGQPSTTVSINVSEPVLDCFTSGEEVGEGEELSVICRLTTEDGVAITDETLECQIQGGDGAVDTDPGYDSATATNVDMEPVETQLGDDTGEGWYWCNYEAETSVPGDDGITIRITDTDRTSLPSTTVIFTASDDNAGGVTQLIVEPLQTNIGPLTQTSVLVIVQDNDEFGVSGAAVTGTAANGVGLVRVNLNTLTNVTISDAMEDLSGGAYFFNIESRNVDDAGEAEVELYNSGGVFLEDQEVPFNIIDHIVTSEATRDSILVDEGFGIVICVENENENPVPGLVSGDWTVTNLGVATTRSAVEELQPASDVAGIDGSGCFVMSVDTAPGVQPGDDVEIRTAVIGQPTNPDDTVNVNIDDVTLELMGHPEFTQSTNCVLITATVRDPEGDPIVIDAPATNGVRVQITQGSGGFKDGDVDDSDCDLTGASTNMFVTENVGTSAVDNGVYAVTFISDVVEEEVEVCGYVEGANSRAEDCITIDIG